jgi:hypothetical protein
MRAVLAVVAVALAACAAAGVAPASSGLVVGVTDDAFLWQPTASLAVARDLGLQAFRVALPWSPGESALAPEQTARFDALVPAAVGLRVVVTVYGRALSAPRTDAARDDYCSYVRDLLVRYPTVDDVVVWNEPNLSFFWQPQFDAAGRSVAPGAYEALLARCWDVAHAVRSGVNVLMGTSPGGNDNPLAVSNVSHSPPSFIRKLGDAFRASGRTRRIFDTVGHNPYGASSAEPPWRKHLGLLHVAQGDVDRLVDALADGFGGTAQPVPGACGSPCVSIWYLEAGYQTVPDEAHRSAYAGRENDAQPIPDAGAAKPTQASQLADGIALAYCQPYVGAYFNFLLRDEPDLARWQSGVLWTDGGRKGSFEALRRITADVAAKRIDCGRFAAGRGIAVPAVGDALLARVEWPSPVAFSTFNDVWSFSLEARAAATYRAVIARAGRPGTLRSHGSLKPGKPRLVRFPSRTLAPGTYRIALSVTRLRGSRLTVTRRSPAFTVR